MKKLTLNNVHEVFDRQIEWSAGHSGGIAIIRDICASSNPIIADIISGDELNLASSTNDVDLYYLDEKSIIEFRII